MNGYTDELEQVDRDLAEIEAQLAAGELDAATAERLRAVYGEERAALLAAAAVAPPTETGRSRRRTLAGGVILGIGIVGIASFAILSLQDETPAGEVTDGVATEVLTDGSGVDLAAVSNEEMEEVVADNPTIIGMRLALAGRYVESGDHSSALDHYLVVLDQDPEQAEALAMVGWLSYLAGEPELAEPFVAKALAIEPNYPSALWFLANIRRDLGDPDAAVAAIGRLLAFDLPPDVRAEAERFLVELQP